MLFKREQKQEVQPSSDVPKVGDSMTNQEQSVSPVGSDSVPQPGFRRLGKHAPKIFIGLGVVLFLILVVGLFNIFYTKTYKIGSQTFTSKDFSKTNNALKGVSQSDPNGRKQRAEDRVVMLAALKAEADKRKVSYSTEVLDQYLASTYAADGGKQAYMKYMKNTHGWSEDDVYDSKTIDYLKEKLQTEILADKSFAVVYIRWDNLHEVDKTNFESNLAAKEQLLKTKYQPLLSSTQTIDQIGKQVDIYGPQTESQVQQVYDRTNSTPVMLQTEKPGDIKYTLYASTPDKKNLDPQTFFAAAKTKGEVIGPVILADGRLMVARLESTGKGVYANWDDFLAAARKEAGLSNDQGKEDQDKSTKNEILSFLKSLNVFRTNIAYAGNVDCAGHLNPVTYNFSAVDIDTNERLTGGSFAAQATRNMNVCDEAGYIADGYQVSGSYPWRTVQKTVWGVPGQVKLDCVGYDWSFWAPAISGYTYKERSVTGTYANNGTVNIVFKYKKPPTQVTTCSLTIQSGSAADLRKIKIAVNGPVDGMVGELTSSVSNGSQTFNPVSSSMTSGDVKPQDPGTSIYTVNITKAGKPVTSCSTSITLGGGGNNGSGGCTLRVSGNTDSYVDPYTASWSITNQPAGSSVYLYGSGSGNTATVTGYSSWAVSPKKPTATNPRPTTTYQLTVKRSNGTIFATCSTTITIGGPCTSNCVPVIYGWTDTYFECTVTMRPIGASEDIGYTEDSNQVHWYQVEAGKTYRVTPTIIKHTNITTTNAWGVPEGYNPTETNVTAAMGADYFMGDLSGESLPINVNGTTYQPERPAKYQLTLKAGHTPTFPDDRNGNTQSTYSPPDGVVCFGARTGEVCTMGTKPIDVAFVKGFNPDDWSYRVKTRGGIDSTYHPHSWFNGGLLSSELQGDANIPKRPLQGQLYDNGRGSYDSGFGSYSYTAPFEYVQRTGPSETSPFPNNPIRIMGQTYGGGYTGNVLTWSYFGSGDELALNQMLVAVVTKDGEVVNKGIPYPAMYAGYKGAGNTPPGYYNKAGGILPWPVDAVESDMQRVVKALVPSVTNPEGPDEVKVNIWDLAKVDEHWFDYAFPIKNDIQKYGIKFYKIQLTNKSASRAEIIDKFKALDTNGDGLPDGSAGDAAYIGGCGSSNPTSQPANRPYIKVDGADVFSGISFRSRECQPTEDQNLADIKANGYFTNKDARGFSGAQYGVFASGLIGQGETGAFLGNNGYLRNNFRDLLFANDQSDSGESGKFYGSSPTALPCIDPKVDELKNDPNKQTPTLANLPTTVRDAEGTIYFNGTVTLPAITGITGNKTLIVDGTVTIGGSLTYDGSFNPASMPHLKIIANNINISKTPSLMQIDGELVAYPTAVPATNAGALPGLANGVLDTCGNGTWGAKLTINSADSCYRRLVINGSLTAQRILWKGTFGTIGSDTEWVDGSCSYRDYRCAAEYINYKPELYISRFNGTSFSDFGKALNSVELPPTY